jgi:hypothetical protein
MTHPVSRGTQIVLAVFVAATTLFGAFAVVPTLPPEWLEGSIFADYTIPAIGLAAVGVVAIVTVLGLIIRPEIAGLGSVLTGATMIVFELVEIWAVGLAIVEYGADEPVAWLQIVYLGIGLIQVVLGLGLWRATQPERDRWMRTGHHLIGTHA